MNYVSETFDRSVIIVGLVMMMVVLPLTVIVSSIGTFTIGMIYTELALRSDMFVAAFLFAMASFSGLVLLFLWTFTVGRDVWLAYKDLYRRVRS